jgi:formamidopyrimidine-DNA glycosylase
MSMPELPEVEHLRRSLAGVLAGRWVRGVTVARGEVVRGAAEPAALLAGARIEGLARRGKQLALVAARADGTRPVLCIHLGMTGALHWEGGRAPGIQGASGQGRGGSTVAEISPAGVGVSQQRSEQARPRRAAPAGAVGAADGEHAAIPPPYPHAGPARSLDPSVPDSLPPHTHLVWHFDGGESLAFRDVRRFGGVWPFADWPSLEARRWHRLGGDALTIRPRTLHAGLRRTRRAVKAALLDQQLLAGLGNIYVDELLFAAGMHPETPAHTLGLGEVQRLVRRMRRLLTRAIEAGGSTFRDYVDATGEPGGFQRRHRVYGRAGLPCRRCTGPLASAVVAGRTTVYCPACQRP